MAKRIFFSFLLTVIFFILINSCNEPASDNSSSSPFTNQQVQIDSLKNLVNDMKPGLGELMLGIQTHHTKLWFAGKNENWKLAGFEMDEMRELIKMAQKIETDREEIYSLPMIFPALDSLTFSINKHDKKLFENDFVMLTNTCNACHTKTNFEFNVIIVPNNSAFPDQDFSSTETK